MRRRERMLRDLDRDIRDHTERETQDNIERGMAPEEARYAAMRKFGNVTRVKEDVREVWSLVWLEQLQQDIRLGLRQLRKNPGFTIVVILTLALGIGASTAIFSVINAVLLRPLPVHDPQRVVVLHDQLPTLNSPRTSVSAIQFREFSRREDLFDSSAVLLRTDLNLAGRDQPLRVEAMQVTENFFRVLRINPMLGRTFSATDDTYGSSHVALLSRDLWQRLFGGDRNAIGKRLKLDGGIYELVEGSFEIIGVMPESLELLYPHVELWIPVAFPPGSFSEDNRWLLAYDMISRLRPGVTLAQAQAGMATEAARFNDSDFAEFGIEVRPLVDEQVGDVRAPLYIVLGAVGLVLLIACSNIAGLLLARNGTRAREIAIRVAIGAGRARIVLQLLAESLLLSIAGGALGVLLARACINVLIRMAPGDLPHVSTVRLDLRVLGFAFAVTLLAGILFGLIPAVQSARVNLTETLKEGGGGSGVGRGKQRLRRTLVVFEIAIALVLLACSGLLLRSFTKLLDVRTGFDPSNLLTMNVSLSPTKYRDSGHTKAFADAVVRQVSTLPGVTHAAFASGVPFSSYGYSVLFQIRDRHTGPHDPTPHANDMYVTPGYFETMRIPLIRGRLFEPREMRSGNVLGPGAVVVIDQSLAKRLWPDSDPLSAEIGWEEGKWATIIGIVGDVHDSDLATESKGMFYVPGYGGTTLVVRAASDPRLLISAVREQIRAVDAEQPVYGVSTMGELVAVSLARRRFVVTLLALFTTCALALASIGISGVIAYLVTLRTHEIGIRLALGAQRANVLRLILSQGLLMSVVGVAIGLVAALFATPLLASQLFGVHPADFQTFVAVSLLLMGVAMVASYIPARRAMRVDPMAALRYE
jgi:predicted permease